MDTDMDMDTRAGEMDTDGGDVTVWIVTARCDGCKADVPGETWRLCALGDDYSQTETLDGCAYRRLFDDPESALEWARQYDGDPDTWRTYIDCEVIPADEWRAVCRPLDPLDVEGGGIALGNGAQDCAG